MIKKKSVLITGCSSGIGQQMALRFEEAGWHVIATSRKGNVGLKLDLHNRKDRQEICQYIQKHCQGQLDCLINNAGYALIGLLESFTDEQIREMIETNLLGGVFLTRDLLPALQAAQGRIINISSLFGIIGYPHASIYSMSKFALYGLTESLRHELSPYGVQVAMIVPATHKTRFGENMILGKCSPRFLELREELRSSPKIQGPDPVAYTAIKLAQRKNMPLKVFVGNEERLVNSLKRILPDHLFQWILGKISKR